MSARLVAGPLEAIDGVRGWSAGTMTRAWGVSSRCAIAAGAGGFWSASPDVISADRADSMIRMVMHYSGWRNELEGQHVNTCYIEIHGRRPESHHQAPDIRRQEGQARRDRARHLHQCASRGEDRRNRRRRQGLRSGAAPRAAAARARLSPGRPADRSRRAPRAMTTFVDTNVLVYAHDVDAGGKHARAQTLIAQLWQTRERVLSTQVLQEFYVNVTRKIPKALPNRGARDLIETYSAWRVVTIDPPDLVSASDFEDRFKLSFWDALVVVAALKANAAHLLTEDLHDGRKI